MGQGVSGRRGVSLGGRFFMAKGHLEEFWFAMTF